MKNIKLSKLAVASAITFSLLACGQKTTEESLVSAEQYVQVGKVDAAIIELKNAINQAPENGTIRLTLGKLYIQKGALRAAEKELHKAQERGVLEDDVVPLFAKVFYYTDQFEAAKLLEIDKLSERQALSTAVFFQYLASLQSTDDKSIISLEDIKTSLSEEDLLVAKAYTNFYNRDYDKAETQLQQLSEMNYRPAETEYLKGLNSYVNADYALAVDSFKKVKELMPQPNEVNFKLIESMINAEQLDNADVEADRLLMLKSNNPLIDFYKGNIAYKRKDFEQASIFAEKAIQNGLDNASVRMIAGVSAFQLDSLEQAYKHLYFLSQRQGFHSDDVNRLLARVQLSLGYNVEASNSLQSLQQLDKSDAELFSLTGAKLAMEGDLGGAKELFSEASDLDSENATVKLRKAAMNFGRDEKQAIQLLKEVIAGDKDLDVGWMQLAMAHVRNGDKAAAIDVANQWFDINKANGKTLEGIIYFRYGDLNDSQIAFKEALSFNPKHLGASQYLLKIYEKLDQPENILASAKNILSFSPNNLQSLIAAVNAANTLGQSSEIEAYLSALNVSDIDSKGPIAAVALSKRLNGKPDEAIGLLSNVSDLDTLGYITLGDAYMAVGDKSAALATYEKWSVKFPNSLFPILRVIAVYELDGNIQNALNLAESSLAKFPNNNTLEMLQLHYATKLNQTDKANKIVQKLKDESRKENVTLLPYYEGQLALNEMDYEKAEKLLTKAHNDSPNYISAAMLAKAMIANGHKEHAKEMLEKQLNSGGAVPESFKSIIASFYTYINEYEKAAAMYKNLMSGDKGDPALLNNFAFNTLMANGDLEVALTAAEKAVKLAPGNAGILDTLAWIEFKSGLMGRAYTNISAAAELDPNSNQINLHFAEILISIGNTKKAQEVLNKIKRPSDVESQTLKQLRNSLNI
ncbi:XrtA/PEP-CTERM system TPR-repeat protein PrsT [uncultured Paraglaciecola sp.]|uniref:XrtA/PEP-CTERM system TPR-repeat protein PrsT n=1 Tax=uncultured Paraglaciecola sp. TaxID=1765024 RepID=UPI0026342953|nr:XrtA/PEP-CTERM system TPR-repeat protein PrsT [uncultured Paraglaciecola sp.]